MMLTRWIPRNASLTPWSEFDRMMEELSGRWNDDGFLADRGGLYPRADVVQTDDGFDIEVELPGLKAKDVKVEISDNVLTISGEKTAEKRENTKGYSRNERTYGSFCRSFRLPATVDEKKISANFEDGVLTIALPKKEEVKPKLIEVKVG